MAAGYFEDPVRVRFHAAYFTADFLSSQFAHGARRHFDSAPCASMTYASERSRSLRYFFGPTVLKAMNHQEYLESRSKSLRQLTVDFSVGFYVPFPAGMVYANLTSPVPAVDSSLGKSGRGLTAPFDAYISVPSPFIDRAILNDPEHESLLEIVCFKTASNPKKKIMPEVSFILTQINKTGLFEKGREIRRQQMMAAYLGKHHTQRTYSQRVLDDSKPSDGEEVYWLKLPEKSGPFYPGLFKDPQWTFELVIKFLTYAVPSLQKSHDNRSRLSFFDDYLTANDIISGIDAGLMSQSRNKTSSAFHYALVQSQKYRFLEANSTISAMLYQKSLIGDDVISPPIRRFTETSCIILGARRTLLQGNETSICIYATISFAPDCPMNLPSLQLLKMPFRIPKGLAGEAAKRGEALRQLKEMTELNGLEEDFDSKESALASASAR